MYLEFTDSPQGDLLPKKDLSNLQDQELFQVAFSLVELNVLINSDFAAVGGSLPLQETQRQAGKERNVQGK